MHYNETSWITSQRLHDNVQYLLILAFFMLTLTYEISLSTQLPNGGLAISLDNNFNPIRPCGNNSVMFGGIWSLTFAICELMNQTIGATYVAISPQLTTTACRIGSGKKKSKIFLYITNFQVLMHLLSSFQHKTNIDNNYSLFW